MPIANCIIAPELKGKGNDLVTMWSHESSKAAEQMTVNIIRREQQYGNKYDIIVDLWLLSLWPESDISDIQLGLARALSKHFDVTPDQILIMTQPLTSGHVVEGDLELDW